MEQDEQLGSREVEGYSFCWEHCVHEYVGKAHEVCFECGHVYRYWWSLKLAYYKAIRSFSDNPGRFECITRTLQKKEIYFCQECLHDF